MESALREAYVAGVIYQEKESVKRKNNESGKADFKTFVGLS